MRINRSAVSLVSSLLVLLGSATAEGARSKKKLSRPETVELFGALSKAAATAKTFQTSMKRSEMSAFVMDDEPLVSEGKLWIERPSKFRQDIEKPRRSVTVANGHNLWVYFPAAKEAQHIDIRKGIRGRADTTSESIMPWLTFNLEGLEKKYKITAKKTSVPSSVTLRKHPAGGKSVKIESLPKEKPASCFKIDFVPIDPKFAPGLAILSIWVDGKNPWPLKIERESVDGDLQTTEFSDLVLDAPVRAKLFDFKPPAGTKIVELTQ